MQAELPPLPGKVTYEGEGMMKAYIRPFYVDKQVENMRECWIISVPNTCGMFCDVYMPCGMQSETASCPLVSLSSRRARRIRRCRPR
jgi:hypothetical protein